MTAYWKIDAEKFQQDLKVRDGGILIKVFIFRHHAPSCFYYLKQRFGDWSLLPPSRKKPTQLGPTDRASPSLLQAVPSLSRSLIHKLITQVVSNSLSHFCINNFIVLTEKTKLNVLNKILEQISSLSFGLRFGHSFELLKRCYHGKEVDHRCVKVNETILNAKDAFNFLS
jgi:hypothetical protein